MLRVTPVYGSRYDVDGVAEAPTCTLIEYGGVKVLWNVGWWGEATATSSSANTTTPSSTPMMIQPTTTSASSSTTGFPSLPDHDCLIVSDSTLNSLGGLPLYYQHYCNDNNKKNNNQKRKGNKKRKKNMVVPPMYATFPTVKMGHMTLYDHHASISLDGGKPPYSLEEMDDAMNSLQTIKYSQTVAISGGRSYSYSQGGDDDDDDEEDDDDDNNVVVNKQRQQPTLSITAHRAGHVVGGAFFVLQRLQDETIVVLTPPTYNIAKEGHLDSATLLKHGVGADVLVTYPGGPALKYANLLYGGSSTTKSGGGSNKNNRSSKSASAGKNIMKFAQTRSTATKTLLETILSVLRRDGHVLLPVDASGRVLELVLLLSQHWDKQRLNGAYNLCWLGPMVQNTIDYTRSQLEWMATQLGAQFEDGNQGGGGGGNKGGGGGRGGSGGSSGGGGNSSSSSGSGGGHPFSLRNVHLCSNIQQLDAYIQQNNNNPTCVLASGLSLDHGPARDLLLRWADNADNAIIFTDSSRCFARRTTRTIMEAAEAQQHASSEKMEVDETGVGSSTEVNKAKKEDNNTTTSTTATTTTPTKPPVIARQVSAMTADVVDPADNIAADQDVDDNELMDGDETTMLATKGSALSPDDKVSPFCVAAQLLQQWCLAKWEGREMDDVVLVDVYVPIRSPLAGHELKTFLAQEEAKRLHQKQLEEKQAMLREVELAKGRLRLSEQGEETGTTTATTTGGTASTTGTASAGGTSSSATTNVVASQRPKKKSRFDSSLFLKFSKPLHLQFEVREEAVGVGQSDSIAKYGIGESMGRSGEILEDDYGIAVKPERFTDIVSGVDPSKFAGGSGRIGDDVRRGFGFGGTGGVGGGKGGAGAGNAGNDDEAGDLEDEMDEQAMEAADLSEGTGIIRGRNGRPPTKVTTVLRRLEVLAEVAFVPLEGRVDARSARQSVRALQPRQVVVLGGRKTEGDSSFPHQQEKSELPLEVVDEVAVLAEAAQTFLIDRSSKVQTPSDGESAELNVGHAAYSARLVDTPYQTREEKQYDLENGIDPPEPIEPCETKVGSCTVSLLDTVATGQKVALDGSIVLAPRPQTRESAMTHPSIYISDGEVLVTDLRSELIAQGMKAEYSTHEGYAQLIVNGKILVKKAKESTRLDVEGPLCEDFWTVRGVIAGQYVTL